MRIVIATMALALQPLVNAAVSQTCPDTTNGICYSLSIPEQTASSGTGDIFFQMTAPTSYEWVGLVALGQGSRMAGSSIFVMYTSANGSNVTVSTRRGIGHVEPSHDGATAQITVLSGSTVSDGKMTANVRCSNCTSWTGGTMDFTSSNGSWIHAYKKGTPITSDELDADISYHDDYGVFDWNLTAAKGGSEVNPFVTAAATTNTTTTTSTSAAPGRFAIPSNLQEIKKAHGFLASIAFILVFPSGAILIRVGNFPQAMNVHRGLQFFGLALFTAAMGLGAWMTDKLSLIGDTHIIIGIVVYILMFIQPITGTLHHIWFKKVSARTLWSQAHLWLGRGAIILGLVNGGLGLKLGGKFADLEKAKIAYGVLAGIFGTAYLVAIAFGERRRRMTRRNGSGSEQEMVVTSAIEKR
ncbi:Hypothetical predicted protein [Lecanosticta acicola]|uniref:Cytochrome b561 domain-containing protein n=1 Tax=Lecanosticta acicola TaxID=111012 RepID=A0AAI8Z1V8_9PEZI|nr:Hypothetical predicted protein [Lecanosticta acicola]